MVICAAVIKGFRAQAAVAGLVALDVAERDGR
jgi:hypothetical protein